MCFRKAEKHCIFIQLDPFRGAPALWRPIHIGLQRQRFTESVSEIGTEAIIIAAWGNEICSQSATIWGGVFAWNYLIGSRFHWRLNPHNAVWQRSTSPIQNEWKALTMTPRVNGDDKNRCYIIITTLHEQDPSWLTRREYLLQFKHHERFAQYVA